MLRLMLMKSFSSFRGRCVRHLGTAVLCVVLLGSSQTSFAASAGRQDAVARQPVYTGQRSAETADRPVAGKSSEIVVDNVRRSLRQGVASEMARLERSLSLLATAANTAPFIGLFGTVWGIMHSFHSIGMLKSASLATVAPGISEALVATAIGLGVAVPATIGFNIFMGKLSQVDTLLVNFAGVFLNRVQRELNAHRPVQRTGATEM